MQVKVQFRDITTMDLLYKIETTIIPYIGNIVMIEKDQFEIQKVLISFDKKVIICYGKIL
jgi:hypothetical protein